MAKNLSDIKLETLSSKISKMPKTIPQKQATATPAEHDDATPATVQVTATPAATETPQTIPGTSRDSYFPTPYHPEQPTTVEETKTRFQMAAISFTKVEYNVMGMGNLLTRWTLTLSKDMEVHRPYL